MRVFCAACVLLGWGTAAILSAAEYQVNGHGFTVPDGFEVTLAAGPPAADRPINATLDSQGRLYVTVSSGSNDDVETQLRTRPHRVVRLEDSDGDGVYERHSLFADKLMFPEGALWYDGSLYVAAPPEIWKFTDTDDDGHADQREVWFDGKTLTGCANDLHGPYLGLDGWIYWCKGAYAEQTYERPGRKPFVTRAAHIFRRHPDGGYVDVVMTGGMANPVEVVFTPTGERIFTTTFLVRPQHGLRDGLIHAIYGGAYGERRPQVLEQPRTGPLMSPLVHLGAAAPSGLARLRSKQLGDGFAHNLMATLFNMRSVTRHVLTPQGATFAAETTDFLVSDQLDFHPTDVLEDVDGSLLVVDTGGWYKLCCPTSQLWKPDILGAIYRVRRVGHQRVDDPTGRQIAWDRCTPARLRELLSDDRHVVASHAANELVRRVETAELVTALDDSKRPNARLAAIWALGRLNTNTTREVIRAALRDHDARVQQAALNLVSLHRDRLAVPQLLDLMRSDKDASLALRRLAAEALGRCRADVTRELLETVATTENREFEHALIYAMLEIDDRDALRRGLASDSPAARRASLIALDQMEDSDLQGAEVAPLLDDVDRSTREAAWWVAVQHPEWGDDVAAAVDQLLQQNELTADVIVDRIGPFVQCESVQDRLRSRLRRVVDGDSIADGNRVPQVDRVVDIVLRSLASSESVVVSGHWHPLLLAVLKSRVAGHVEAVLGVLDTGRDDSLPSEFVDALLSIAGDEAVSPVIRLRALASVPPSRRRLSPTTWRLIVASLGPDKSFVSRGHAADALESIELDEPRRFELVTLLHDLGPMEIRRLLPILAASGHVPTGRRIVDALLTCPSVTMLTEDELSRMLSGFGTEVSELLPPVVERIDRERGALVTTIEQALARIEHADVRRGQAVFHSSRAACTACHKLGYVGGQIGPGLNRIGKTRSERDLLEAILLPSNSFVQNYEPVVITTVDGRILQGLVEEETADRVRLRIDAQRVESVAKENIESQEPGRVSIMPAGLEKHLTLQELADLVAFLKSAD